MNTYYFEMTDTFGGELNYCWIERFAVKAKTSKGALQKLSKETGLNFRYYCTIGAFEKRWNAKKACIALYEISEHDFDGTIFNDWLLTAKNI